MLGGHGLFTWGETQRECYLNTITVIDQIGQFIERHGIAKGPARFGGEAMSARATTAAHLAVQIAPYLRGRVSTQNPLDRELHRRARRAAVRELRPRARIWPSSAPVAPTTSSAPKSVRCLFPGRRTQTWPR